jgi:hypothetical protein
MKYSEDLKRVAKRVVWFKTPDEALREPKLFLAHLMTYGTLEDIATAMKYYSEADFDLVLKDPPAGIFDVRSWNYWNLRYRHEPVPALPQRTLPESDVAGG